MSTMTDPITGERFEYRTRGDWGAQAARARYALASSSQGLKDHWVVAGEPASISAVDSLARQIQHQHKNILEWYDYAYNFSWGAIGDKGFIVEGRGFGIANGAQGGGSHCHALSWYGGGKYPEGTPPGGAPGSAAYRARLCIERNIAANGFAVSPNTVHRMEASTACPGDAIEGWVLGGKPVSGVTPPAPKPPKPPADDCKYAHQTPRALRYSTPLIYGDDVAEWQFLMNLNMGANQAAWIVVDGYFGRQSEQATKSFQNHMRTYFNASVTVDGVVGAQTRGLLCSELNRKGYW